GIALWIVCCKYKNGRKQKSQPETGKSKVHERTRVKNFAELYLNISLMNSASKLILILVFANIAKLTNSKLLGYNNGTTI
nr:hypothetical protein [Gammaproteobacteria bacterium]